MSLLIQRLGAGKGHYFINFFIKMSKLMGVFQYNGIGFKGKNKSL